ncbi:hypothetical protein MMPV_001847 [Pyropia vietnamensis]
MLATSWLVEVADVLLASVLKHGHLWLVGESLATHLGALDSLTLFNEASSEEVTLFEEALSLLERIRERVPVERMLDQGGRRGMVLVEQTLCPSSGRLLLVEGLGVTDLAYAEGVTATTTVANPEVRMAEEGPWLFEVPGEGHSPDERARLPPPAIAPFRWSPELLLDAQGPMTPQLLYGMRACLGENLPMEFSYAIQPAVLMALFRAYTGLANEVAGLVARGGDPQRQQALNNLSAEALTSRLREELAKASIETRSLVDLQALHAQAVRAQSRTAGEVSTAYAAPHTGPSGYARAPYEVPHPLSGATSAALPYGQRHESVPPERYSGGAPSRRSGELPSRY